MSDALPTRMNLSPTRKTLVKQLRNAWLRLAHAHNVQLASIAAASLLLLLFLLSQWRGPAAPFSARLSAHRHAQADGFPLGNISLFIAVGSAPGNAALRQAARDTWLRWLPPDASVAYRFFTDAPPPSGKIAEHPAAKDIWLRVYDETQLHDDLVLQPLPGGYGDKEHNAYSRRARFQLKWALHQHPGLRFFLRVDDDSFLCLHKLVYELKSVPVEQFFWGRFWCREGRNRADENFMLFSSDVAKLLADDGLVGKLLPFDDEVTLGWNFGYWTWVLNMTIFDDQKRLDAQQGYLTKYMHGEAPAEKQTLAGFCESYMYAHHVHEGTMRAAFAASRSHLMYELPRRKGPNETCSDATRSFVPARHSAILPDIQIRRATHGA